MMISVCLKITAVLLQAETKVFVMLWALDGLWISVFLLASFSKLYHKKILSCPRFENLRDLTQEGLPFMLSGFCIAIMMRSDHIMLHNMLGPKSAGTYAAAIRLTEPWYFISGAILTVMLPKLIDAQKEGIHTYHKAIKRLFRLLFFGSLSICIPLCLLSSFIVKLCYGEAYQASAQILQIHCWTILFVFSSAVSNKWCLLEKKQHLLLARAMIGMSINLVLNWMLIPHLKETGAAIATLASQMTSGYLCLLIFPSSRNLFRLLNKGWLSK
jgi:O-antigen/teichoic acid export membrane protein